MHLLRDTGFFVVLVLIYFAAAKFGLSMAFVAEQVTVVWPPTGISIAALLILGRRFWPAISVGALLANITTGAPVAVALGIATGNTLEALLPAWVLQRYLDFNPRLERLWDAVTFVLIAALTSTTISATTGVTSLCLAGVKEWSEYFLLWRVWWLGDTASALVVAPPLLIVGSRLTTAWARGRLAEAIVVCAVLCLTSSVVFAGGLGANVSAHPLEYILFPFVIWSALRLGPLGTSAVVFVASAVAVWGTRSGFGPFSVGTVHENLFLLQAFMAVIAITGLVLSAVIAEWKATEKRRAVEHAASGILARCSGIDEAAPEMLRSVCDGAGWDVGAFWRIGPDGLSLRCQEFWKREAASSAVFEQATCEQQFSSGVGLPGRVWASKQAAWIVDAPHEPNFPRAQAASTSGLRSGFAFPILLEGRVLGVFEFFSRERRLPDTQLLAMTSVVGNQFGQFIERKQAAAALRTAREQLQIVTDTMSAAVTRCSRDLNYVWVSKRYAEWLGRRPEDIAGHSIASIIGDMGLASVRPYIERVLSGEPVEYEAYVDFKGPGGRWIEAVYTPTFDEFGTANGWVAVVNDVTAHKLAEQRLLDAARQKDEYLAMLAHELRNPLAPMRTAAEVLRVRGDDPAIVAHSSGIIERQVTHMARLVDDLLDVSRISCGKISIHRQRLDLARLAQVSAADHRQDFDDAGLSFVVVVPESPLWVSGDATRLTQVLDNLLDNARKFTDRGGTVTLDVWADTELGHALLRIRDTGIGIEPEMLTRLFAIFSQADRSLDRSRGGLGLGLALVKGLVELHQGQVKATSDGPGQGSEFIVRIPLELERSIKSDDQAPRLPIASSRLRVLVVEDNRDTANSMKMLLEAFGHEAMVAYNGTEGVETARRVSPDVVVCDIGLPGMDGFAVARVLRDCPETANARLIAVTGYGQDEDRERAHAAGFDDHLVKPADPIRLLTLLS